MTSEEILEKLAPVAKQVLKIDAFTSETTMEATPHWTSLRHIQILTAIERAFGIQISEIDAFKLRSGAKIIAYVKSRMPEHP